MPADTTNSETEQTSATTAPATTPSTPPAAPQVALNWDDVLKGLSPEQRAAYDANIAGLKGALDKEREAARTAAGKLKEALTSADAERAAKLSKLQSDLDAANARIAFISAPEAAQLIDIEAAYLIASAKGLIADGKPKWDELKAAHPALWRAAQQPPPPPVPEINNGARGSGAGQFNGQTLEEIAARYNLPLPATR